MIFSLYYFLTGGCYFWVISRKLGKSHYMILPEPTYQHMITPRALRQPVGPDHSAMKQEHAYVLSHSEADSAQQCNFQTGHGKGCSKTGCLMVVCSLTHSGCVCFSLGCLPIRCHFCRGCYSRPRGKFIFQNTEFTKDTKNI